LVIESIPDKISRIKIRWKKGGLIIYYNIGYNKYLENSLENGLRKYLPDYGRYYESICERGRRMISYIFLQPLEPIPQPITAYKGAASPRPGASEAGPSRGAL